MQHYDLSNWTVVIVDDEPDSLEVLCEVLEMNDATVKAAESGEEAIRLLSEARPTVILTDISMPHMDGYQLLFRLRKLDGLATVPVIALTAHAMRGDRERAMAAGFRNFINKPLDSGKFMNELLVILLEQPEFAGKFD